MRESKEPTEQRSSSILDISFAGPYRRTNTYHQEIMNSCNHTVGERKTGFKAMPSAIGYQQVNKAL